MNSKPLVLIVMGSKSDKNIADGAIEILKKFNIPFKITVSSAHRTPERTIEIARRAEQDGVRVIIAIAGWSAGLPGTIAAETILPVIGVPVPSSVLLGMDAMFSMIQMPPGVPVATMAVGKGGAKNAALLATQILAGEFSSLKTVLKKYKQNLANQVAEDADNFEYIFIPDDYS